VDGRSKRPYTISGTQPFATRATPIGIANRVPLTDSTLEVRPVIGERVARHRTTLEDVIDAAPTNQRPEIMRQLRDYLGYASATSKCWNRVYCMRERVYPAVLEAVVNEVLSLNGVRDVVLARVKELHEKGDAVAAELKKLDKELDFTEYDMENCAAIVRPMEAEGLAEPYRRLTEKPGHVPQ
jgi:hypothetical protein